MHFIESNVRVTMSPAPPATSSREAGLPSQACAAPSQTCVRSSFLAVGNEKLQFRTKRVDKNTRIIRAGAFITKQQAFLTVLNSPMRGSVTQHQSAQDLLGRCWDTFL